jgi:hypothetical protein
LTFAGVRLTPFGERVRTGSITVPGAPGAAITAGRVGLLTSPRGDTAEVIRRGDMFTVAGVTRTGQYQDTVDLLPGRPGGEAEGLLRVRDLPVWPLLVLMIGLLIVQLLDRYRDRERPRQVLDLRLARLRDRAFDAQRDLNETYRIAARAGEPALLLDRRVRGADRRFAVVGGTLVVLSGMSVVYVANPTFGSPGDYLAVTLWGAAFGEGLTLAHRLWPTPT